MTEFEVQGMSCQHCVAAVTRSIHEIDPQAQVRVDLERGRVTVESSQTNEALIDAIDDAGYTVKGAASA
ncbi:MULTISPECIES: heavy-metal-associated domain-containing protein [unclassified Caballeronia]|uniref:heavy-metal-associated domain-containing protein n=1 Tax=unclassified Caballeronia TaxID=2646786 RepID=UPI0020298D48|nr:MULTISPECIES: heavy-metal-associated domain-containing protein [unclassified Caballeronia]MDR5771857.1 heavy-metal-associated domain-containing protein [Caballeronia sp. LZ002]MDR5847292.1 heavy-metal-associated domain-containing protein [Caballeronia sp. LZ003]